MSPWSFLISTSESNTRWSNRFQPERSRQCRRVASFRLSLKARACPILEKVEPPANSKAQLGNTPLSEIGLASVMLRPYRREVICSERREGLATIALAGFQSGH